MSFTNLIILTICILLIQNIFFTYFVHKCNFFSFSSRRLDLFKLMLLTIIVYTAFTLLSYYCYHKILLPNNLDYLIVILFVLIMSICIQATEIFYKKLSYIFELDSKTYLTFVINCCMLIGFSSMLILNDYELFYILKYCFLSSIGYSFGIYTLSFIVTKYDDFDIPKYSEGIPIALITVSILSFALFGIL